MLLHFTCPFCGTVHPCSGVHHCGKLMKQFDALDVWVSPQRNLLSPVPGAAPYPGVIDAVRVEIFRAPGVRPFWQEDQP